MYFYKVEKLETPNSLLNCLEFFDEWCEKTEKSHRLMEKMKTMIFGILGIFVI